MARNDGTCPGEVSKISRLAKTVEESLAATRGGMEVDLLDLSRLTRTDGGQALSFPCNAQGCVDMDALSERRRCDYLFARATIGQDYGWPHVVPV